MAKNKLQHAKMYQQAFTVTEEIPCINGVKDCTCIHWQCPFCKDVGDIDTLQNNMPEYFSVTCKGKVFLVRRAA